VTTETPQTQPKQLIRPMSPVWWLKNPNYTLFMIRDVTSIFIAGYCVFLLLLLSGAVSFESLKSPLSIVLHLIALLFAAYHSISFFNLTPQVIVVFRGEERVPGNVIAGAHYVAWAVVSIILILIALVA
jgi:fumarate reductase subunit C